MTVSPLGHRYYTRTILRAPQPSIDVSIRNPDSNPQVLEWAVMICGQLYPQLQQDLCSRLNDNFIPLSIQNDVVSLIINEVINRGPPASRHVSVGVCAVIELQVMGRLKEENRDLYGKVVIEGGEREKGCAICLEEFELGLEVIQIPCSHLFHQDCIDKWLHKKNECPLCCHLLL